MARNENSSQRCTVCNNFDLEKLLDLGPQPPSNRFYHAETEVDIKKFNISVGYCKNCKTIQLVDRMPIEEIRPQYNWLVYNEPEGHLDEVAKIISSLEGVDFNSKIRGVTYKDKSTLDRLQLLGFNNLACYDYKAFDIPHKNFGLETIQEYLSDSNTISSLKDLDGLADILMVRHIIEHSPSSYDLLSSIRKLVSPGGYIILELPDSEKIFTNRNHPFIWEEHYSYFTAESAARLVKESGATLVSIERYPYTFEDSLVVIMKNDRIINADDSKVDEIQKGLKNKFLKSIQNFELFAKHFNLEKDRWRKELADMKAGGERIALFGAGHLSVKFINYYDLSEYFDCVIDDNVNKLGLKLPGSGLEIFPSGYLKLKEITCCISTLSPESEARVRHNHFDFFQSGVKIKQAFSYGLS